MSPYIIPLLALASCTLGSAVLDAGSPIEVITRDVAIIGGGSAGTYTAIQLQKLGKTVALIETLGQLGGNVNTYVDPTSKETYDVGVVAYENLPVVTEYLNQLDVPYKHLQYASGKTLYANFDTGSAVAAPQSEPSKLSAAYSAYTKQLQKYPYLINGFNLPSKIPSDFLLSWGDFIKKYNLQALAFTVYTYNQGVGNILTQTTLNMLKYLNFGELNQLTTGVALVTTANSNQHIYNQAQSKLGSYAFTHSNVTSVKRSSKGVQLVVETPSGRKLVKAKQLVVAVRPLLSALDPFLDLRSDEQAVFSKWNSSFYWCGLVANTGLPKNVSVNNVNPNQIYSIPTLPGLYGIGSTPLTNGYHTVYFSSPYNQTNEAVQSEISASIQRVRKGLGYPAPYGTPEFKYWRAHRPFYLTVSRSEIENGFYTKLEALQGKHSTYWTGAAWQSEDSSVIWNYTQAVMLPKIMKGLADLEGGSG